MGRRSSPKKATSEAGDTDDSLKKALRLRSAQQMTDLREPSLPATGTEQIARRLADARRLRDEATDQVAGG